MSRGYPRFLFSNPTNLKTDGPFIIHTLEPQFIIKPQFDQKRNIINWKVLKVWKEGYDELAIHTIASEIPSWFRHSGIQQSTNHDDVLIAAVNNLDFLTDTSSHFTVEQAKVLIRLLFPTKTKKIYEGSSSYGIKHLFERVSGNINSESKPRREDRKYCSNDTVIQAFEEEGFKWEQQGPNRYMNISAKEINKVSLLFWNN